MAFEFINKLPTPAEIKEQFQLPAEFIARKAERDEEVKKVISGESDKFLVLIGPCSAVKVQSGRCFCSVYFQKNYPASRQNPGRN